MKHTLFFMLLSVCLSAPAAWAYDFEADGIYYNILSSDNKTVAVTFGREYYLTIPETVRYNGTQYSVTSIDRAFWGCDGLTSVTAYTPTSVNNVFWGGRLCQLHALRTCRIGRIV